MKILHTSDWHLGAMLDHFKRTDEFKSLLDWLLKVLTEEKIEALIIAGDVFHTGLPPNSAAELYYRFLADARNTGVRTVIVVAGNHDSASFIEAPKSILNALACKVVGRIDPEHYDEQIIPLNDPEGKTEAVVCAVPYPRDRYILTAVSGENGKQQQESRRKSTILYYQNICRRARELYPGVPLIATGHFYATGGKDSQGNVIGTLAGISVSDLPQDIDYLALGHLHIPQCVAGRQNCRYPGSLLQLNFSDSDTRKTVLVLDTDHIADAPKEIQVPVFQKMEKITGGIEEIKARIDELKKLDQSVWLRVENSGEFEPHLQQILASFCEDSRLHVVNCHNLKANPALRRRDHLGGKKLNELTPEMVFQGLLDESGFVPERKNALLTAFREAEKELADTDNDAE